MHISNRLLRGWRSFKLDVLEEDKSPEMQYVRTGPETVHAIRDFMEWPHPPDRAEHDVAFCANSTFRLSSKDPCARCIRECRARPVAEPNKRARGRERRIVQRVDAMQHMTVERRACGRPSHRHAWATGDSALSLLESELQKRRDMIAEVERIERDGRASWTAFSPHAPERDLVSQGGGWQ